MGRNVILKQRYLSFSAPPMFDETVGVKPEGDSTAIPLPDIKQVLRKKEIEEEMARIEEEEEETKVRIKRTDRKAMAKVIIPLSVHFVA
jgi:hypothetical protein